MGIYSSANAGMAAKVTAASAEIAALTGTYPKGGGGNSHFESGEPDMGDVVGRHYITYADLWFFRINAGWIMTV